MHFPASAGQLRSVGFDIVCVSLSLGFMNSTVLISFDISYSVEYSFTSMGFNWYFLLLSF